ALVEWDAFVELYGQQRDSIFHPLSYLTKVLGLAALGLAGVTIGAFFAQNLSKHLSASHCPAKPSTSALQRPPLIRRPSSHGELRRSRSFTLSG
ncbi:hypothetical protein QQF64_021815, partial [Cirrhinus molitorella]